MRFPIDLVYLDRKNRVKKVRHSVGPWRLSACLTAHSILELPAGTIRETRTERGDTVEIGPRLQPRKATSRSSGCVLRPARGREEARAKRYHASHAGAGHRYIAECSPKREMI